MHTPPAQGSFCDKHGKAVSTATVKNSNRYMGYTNNCHNCRKSYSQIFELLKPLKISQMFIYQAIKHYEELWTVEDRLNQNA
jgi:hypothetical protein